MANVKNNWVGFLDRSYQQIKNALLSRVTISNPELTDHSPSNPFVIIIDMFAAIAEMLNYYIDNVAKESFFATASRRSSIINHSTGLDYRIKARSPESVDVVLTFDSPGGANFSILSNTSINSNDGYTFRTLEDHDVLAADTFANIPFVQVDLISRTLGSSNGASNQKFQISDKYVHKTMEITIAGQDYFEVNTFANSNQEDRHYVVDIDTDGFAYVRFGDGKKGVVPQNGEDIIANYQDTEAGDNKIDANDLDINTLTLNLSQNLVTVDTANNPTSSSGGAFFESTEDIRDNAMRSLRTLDRAVNVQDHVDIINALPGIRDTAINFCCGEDINLYIVPQGGGLAQQSLINQAQEEINDKSMVLVNPIVRAAGESRLFIRMKVYARPRKSLIDVKQTVEQALLDYQDSSDIKINSNIRLSDIQALIDNLPSVDYLDITELWVEPYARPIGHNNQLNWTRIGGKAMDQIRDWRLEVDSNGDFLVYMDNVLQEILEVGQEWNSPLGSTNNPYFTITINSGSYNVGDRWEFKTYPYLQNVSLRDFTIVKMDLNFIKVSVVSSQNQESSSSC